MINDATAEIGIALAAVHAQHFIQAVLAHCLFQQSGEGAGNEARIARKTLANHAVNVDAYYVVAMIGVHCRPLMHRAEWCAGVVRG